ncbi:Protein hu-li tai shao [Strongyloides ratti]|uniref:Protein hu-li tai shao n=1 Tax=Strongyloides ratti TaxID=34506 RepID=A0A090KW67_STRRB|nr:Protein hu-li tai shao [Strongyloides ratti]CEF59517.1 Protein hu-li tai shao [Strongyloides ratti]
MTTLENLSKKKENKLSKIPDITFPLKKSVSSDIQRLLKMDNDDPEYIKEMQRPATIKQDLSDMERRKRVHQILNSKRFCSQLESVIKFDAFSNISDGELKEYNKCNHYAYLAKASYFHVPGSLLNTDQKIFLPVADLCPNKQYDKYEISVRNKLASLCRLIDYFKWNTSLDNHISLKLNTVSSETDSDKEKEICLLMNSIDLMFHEVTASSLIKINTKNYIIDGGTSLCGINLPKYAIQAAIYEAREDINCIIHLQIPVVTAVSSTKFGLLPICQEAMIIGEVSYHDYISYLEPEKFKKQIAIDLGKNNVLILRNNGFIVCGGTVEETMFLVYNTVIACESMLKTLRVGTDNIILPDEKVVRRIYDEARYKHRVLTKQLNGQLINIPKNIYKIGEFEWNAWMRVLDCIGHKTGHIYKNDQNKINKISISNNNDNDDDITIPPASVSYGKVNENDSQALTAYKISLMKKEQEKIRWLNSPNVYQKIKVLEKGVDNPKVITKWIQDVNHESGVYETPISLNQSNQFITINNGYKEFKTKQKEMKESRLQGFKNAGPKSQILDNLRHNEICNNINTNDSEKYNKFQKPINVGSASKGIIDKKYQNHGQIYNQVYSQNPFAIETDKSLQEYIDFCNKKSEIIRKHVDKKILNRELSDSCSDCDEASLMEAVQEYRRSLTSPQSEEDSSKNENLKKNKTKYSLQDTSNILSINNVEKNNNFSRIFSNSSNITKSEKNQSSKKEKKTKKKRLSIFSFGKKKD